MWARSGAGAAGAPCASALGRLKAKPRSRKAPMIDTARRKVRSWEKIIRKCYQAESRAGVFPLRTFPIDAKRSGAEEPAFCHFWAPSYAARQGEEKQGWAIRRNGVLKLRVRATHRQHSASITSGRPCANRTIEARYHQRRLHSRQVFERSPAFYLGVRFALAAALSVESSGRSCGHRRDSYMEVHSHGPSFRPRGRTWLLLPLRAFPHSLLRQLNPRPRRPISRPVLRPAPELSRAGHSHVCPWRRPRYIQRDHRGSYPWQADLWTHCSHMVRLCRHFSYSG